MIKPYHSEAGITIYHGDAWEILPQIPPSDVLLTDPPYGIAINVRNGANWRDSARPQCVVGDEKPFEPEFLLGFWAAVLWGADHYSSRLPDAERWLVWDKRDGVGPNAQADCEMAWVRGTGLTAARMYRCLWSGAVRSDERHTPRVHPTQKPVALMRWCLGFFPSAKSVCDPFMGSGTTLRAAKDLGMQAVGIEIEEKYCEIAANRLRQEVLQFA